VSYLSCTSCGLTLFDRNPLTSPRRCPRCARRGLSMDLEPVEKLRGRAAASVLGGQDVDAVEGAEQAGR
jgi:DNA-directed RNA polymerase subunit RPC12/RpoP